MMRNRWTDFTDDKYIISIYLNRFELYPVKNAIIQNTYEYIAHQRRSYVVGVIVIKLQLAKITIKCPH